jgi:hypothetical protein
MIFALQDFLSLPRPTGDANVAAPGPNPLRILIFGNGPAAAWGVLDHEVALAGYLARSLAKLTGRGIEIHQVTYPMIMLGSVPHTLARLDLEPFDAVILAVGFPDAGMLRSDHYWRKHLTRILDTLSARLGSATPVFLLGLYPISRIPFIGTWIGQAVDEHSEFLNDVTQDLVSRYPSTHLVTLSRAPFDGSDRVSNAKGYARMASEAAPPIAAALAAIVQDDDCPDLTA